MNSVGYTALHCAVDGKNHKTIPLLLQADPLVANIQDKNGKTALHLACHLSLKKMRQSTVGKSHCVAIIRALVTIIRALITLCYYY